MNSNSLGVIYILTNPAMPGLVKIGYATNIRDRLRTLNQSSAVPYAYRVYAIYEVDSKLTDKELHKLIDSLNPSLRAREQFNGKPRVKEFYEMSPENAYLLLDCIAKISGTSERLKRMTPEGLEVFEEKCSVEVVPEGENVNLKNRRKPFKFSECGIEIGSKIQFIEDATIEAIVVDDRHILFQNEITSLTALAKQLKGIKHEIQGTLWFTYKGRRLTEIRNEIETKK